MRVVPFLVLAAAASLCVPSVLPAQPAWPVASRPVFDASGILDADGTVIERPVGGVLTSAGRVLVADAIAGHVLVLDRSGRLERRAGRSGSGPGEFRGIEWIGACGRDGAVVWDRQTAKITHLAPDGTLGEQLRAPFGPDVASRTIATTCSRAGTYALLTLPRQPQVVTGQVVRGLSAITIVDAKGASRRFPVEVPMGEMVVRGGGGAPRPLGRTTTLLLDESRLVVGTADSAHVAVYALDGTPMGVIRAGEAGREIAKAEYEAAIEELTSTLPPAAYERARQLLLSQPHPERTAPYYGLHLDPSGNVWVRTSAPTERVTRFTVHDRGGRQVARVELPRGITVWDVSADLVLGSYLDDEGEPHVVAYGYRRR